MGLIERGRNLTSVVVSVRIGKRDTDRESEERERAAEREGSRHEEHVGKIVTKRDCLPDI